MTNHLYQVLRKNVEQWVSEDYPCDYPAISEVFDWCFDSETGALRFLRRPQLDALRIYWYLRLVAGTPHVLDLYLKNFGSTSKRLEALGLDHPDITKLMLDSDSGLDALWEQIKSDDDFVHTYRLEALRETITLEYPSYILALAMGAGKTILIGAIIATEFAMAMEYPDGIFVQNALVFAPGKTIIESLRELLAIPYEKILPPRLYKQFAASYKPIFTRDGEKDIPVIRGSLFNVVVTNTEKIRIQKETIRKSDIGGLFDRSNEEARAEVANLRLQAIASLPHLAVFSDEAHHTYGQSLELGLKRVRQTVDYLHHNSPNLICVVNTTGTPYFQRQPLKDVVAWYGLSQGIRDGILKDVSDNIRELEVSTHTDKALRYVIKDFFNIYGDVRLPNGAPAKLAIYFPQTDDLKELRPVIDQALVEAGLSPALCVVNTSDSTLTKKEDEAAFNRLNDPSAPHRLILLVNKGTEGWNCPSLFSCALARRLRAANNFVLQAATRCLRQVPGNPHKARIYLSKENLSILDTQLQETYGESLADLSRADQDTRLGRIVLNKLDVPPLVITQTVRTVVRLEGESQPLVLTKPSVTVAPLLVRDLTIQQRKATKRILVPVGSAVEIERSPDLIDAYAAAVELAAEYRLEFWLIYDELKRIYPEEDVPVEHIPELRRQIETQVGRYEVLEEKVDVALALVKTGGWNHEFDMATQRDIYTAEIRYQKTREHLLLALKDLEANNSAELGFHYSPYNFSSKPEKYFFEELLRQLNVNPHQVEDIYFTGAIRDRKKTDFYVEYTDKKGKSRSYTPDFVIRLMPAPRGGKGSGRVLIVEIKSEREREHETDGEMGAKAMAMRRWERLNPERLKYHMLFTSTDSVTYDQVEKIRTLAASMYT
jgi:hypothetical protein